MPGIQQKFEAQVLNSKVLQGAESPDKLKQSFDVIACKPMRTIRCHVAKFSKEEEDSDTIRMPRWMYKKLGSLENAPMVVQMPHDVGN